MWLVWTLISFVVLGWVGYRWTKTLINKYEHTAESSIVLTILLILANYFSLRLTYVMAPVFSMWPRLILMLPLGLMMFVGFSYVTVNLWCSFLTRDFDERIGALEEEKDNLQRQVDILRWRHVTEGIPLDSYAQDRSLTKDHPPDTDEIEQLREFVDNWQQVGGAARVRSIKVAEWKAQAENWEADRLIDEIRFLTAGTEEEADEIRREQMKARIAVFKIELQKRQESHKVRMEPHDRVAVKGSRESGPEAIRRRLQDIHGEIQLTEAQKRDFLRGKVRLTWRVRS